MKKDRDILVATLVMVAVYLVFIWLWEGLR